MSLGSGVVEDLKRVRNEGGALGSGKLSCVTGRPWQEAAGAAAQGSAAGRPEGRRWGAGGARTGSLAGSSEGLRVCLVVPITST